MTGPLPKISPEEIRQQARRTYFNSAVNQERRRQDEAWGTVEQRKTPSQEWAVILMEEVGEVAKAILEGDINNLKEELVQVAAVASAFYDWVLVVEETDEPSKSA